ncbi:MAG TPA: cytochrome c oxidase assembly factor 1 family protein, partial [Terriglobia bacterium]|nr:cytochrome c oxidase assembly factor 1 family protein [Terriglobia bacterium]
LFRYSDVYKEALAIAQSNPETQQALGTPIEAGFLVSGNISVSGDSGRANLSIPIHGPKGTGRLYLEATKVQGKWTYQKLMVQVDKGPRIDLLDAANSSNAI